MLMFTKYPCDYSDIRGTSLESLPTAGLKKLRNIKATQTPSLKSFAPHFSLPSIRELRLTYHSHCCLYRDGMYPTAYGFGPTCGPTEETLLKALDAKVQDRRSQAAKEPGKCPTEPPCQDANRPPTRYFPRCLPFSQTFGNHRVPACSELANATATPALVPFPTAITTHNTTFVSALPISCYPQPDDFNSCDDVLGNWVLRILVWVVIVINVSGNVTVVAVFLANYKRFNAVKLLLCNMAFADVCMSVYLVTLAIVDAVTFGEFADHAVDWKTGGGCEAIGFISVFSSILSLYSLTVITIERFYTIHYAMYGRKIGFKQALVLVIIGWVYATVMAMLPLVGVSDYTVTAICLPFDLSNGGRAYVIFGLLANLLAFCVIAGIYAYLFCSITGGRRMASRRRDANVLLKMMILVLVDFFCWMPIIVMGVTFASRGDVAISLLSAKYVMVFIYPLNSCANPFLYAIFTEPFKRDFFEFWYRLGYFEKQHFQHSRPISLRLARVGTRDRSASTQRSPRIRTSQSSVITNISLVTISNNSPKTETSILSPDRDSNLSSSGTDLAANGELSVSPSLEKKCGGAKSVSFVDSPREEYESMRYVDQGDNVIAPSGVERRGSTDPLLHEEQSPTEMDTQSVVMV